MATLNDKVLAEQMLLLTRGSDSLYTQVELEQRLKTDAESGKQLRIKLGLDPTAPDIHVGHTVVLRKMRQFQDLGHKAILIIGDYTARIGDPSGQNKTRPVLSGEQIQANAQTYFDQASIILDTAPDKLEIRSNSEWLEKLTLMDLIQLAGKKTVAQMIQRESFKKRLENDVDVFLHEFLYPIIQGYDSVAIEADVELGGTDQTFNILVGRDIQKAYGQVPQIVLLMPLLVGLDGAEKMSKSKGNYIGITDEPNDMFGKVMSIPDSLMDNYFTLLTDLPREKIDELTNGDKTHPRQAQAMHGKAIVAQYYDEAAGEAASAEFDRIFAQKDVPTDMPEIVVPAGAINILELISAAGFAKSTSDARRLVKQSAVSIDGEKVADIKAEIDVSDGLVLKVGKRRFGKIKTS